MVTAYQILAAAIVGISLVWTSAVIVGIVAIEIRNKIRNRRQKKEVADLDKVMRAYDNAYTQIISQTFSQPIPAGTTISTSPHGRPFHTTAPPRLLLPPPPSGKVGYYMTAGPGGSLKFVEDGSSEQEERRYCIAGRLAAGLEEIGEQFTEEMRWLDQAERGSRR